MAKAKTSKPDSSATRPAAPVPFDKLYWLRLGAGAVAGVFADYISSIDLANAFYNGITIAIGVFLVTYYVARYVMYRKLGKEYFTKFYTTGIGGYIMVFLFTWILFFTLVSVRA